MERWLPILGYESYRVSDIGRIKNSSGLIMKLYKDRMGYIYVCLTNNGIPKKFKVHRLVATAFIRPPKEKEQVNHIDGRKWNNNVQNLEWCSAGDNQRHAFRIGLKKGKSGADNPAWISKIAQYDLNGNKMRVWDSFRAIMRETGFDKSAIHRHIKGNKNYSHAYGFKWSYA